MRVVLRINSRNIFGAIDLLPRLATGNWLVGVGLGSYRPRVAMFNLCKYWLVSEGFPASLSLISVLSVYIYCVIQ